MFGRPVDLVLVVLAGALAVAVRPAWRVVRYPVTVVHELGHVVLALAFGGRRARVRLRTDTSGLTTWRAPTTGRVRRALIALAGPAAPAAAGLACVLAYRGDRATLGVAVLGVAAAAVALIVRNAWGLVVCLVLVGLAWLAWQHGPEGAAALLVGSAAVLCLGGARAVVEEMQAARHDPASDTQVAAAALWLPAPAWGVALLCWSVGCTVLAAWRLVHLGW